MAKLFQYNEHLLGPLRNRLIDMNVDVLHLFRRIAVAKEGF